MFQIDIFNYLNKESTNFRNLLFLISLEEILPSILYKSKKKRKEFNSNYPRDTD